MMEAIMLTAEMGFSFPINLTLEQNFSPSAAVKIFQNLAPRFSVIENKTGVVQVDAKSTHHRGGSTPSHQASM
jgi:hypothetical protein